jgi:CRP/FNR family transcriptional regulator
MVSCVKVDSSAFLADQELIEALQKRSVPVVCGEDRTLFRQGDAPSGLYILHTGNATLTMETSSGKVVLCIQPSDGSLLGLPGLVGNEPYSMSANASKGSELSFVARKDFDDLMQTDPTLLLRVLHVLAAEVRSARHALL